MNLWLLKTLPSARYALDWQFAKGATIVVVGNMVARALGFLFPILLTWLYLPEDFGFIRYIIAITYLLGEAISGFPAALARFLGKHSANPVACDCYFTNAIVGTLLLSVSISTLAFSVLLSLGRGYVEVPLVLLGLTIDEVYFGLVRGCLRYNRLVIYRISSNILKFVLIALLALIGYYPPTLALLIFAFSYALPIAILEIREPLGVRFGLSFVSRRVVVELAAFALPLMVNAGAYGVISGLDMVVLERFYGFEEVGLYGAAKTITILFTLVPFGITTLLMPKVAGMESMEQVARYLNFSLVVTTMASLALLLAILLGGKLLVAILFPAGYARSVEALWALSAGMALFAASSIMSQTLTGIGKPLLSATGSSLGAATNVVASLLLIPPWGMLGAGLALVASYGACAVFFGIAARRELSPRNKAVAKPSPPELRTIR